MFGLVVLLLQQNEFLLLAVLALMCIEQFSKRSQTAIGDEEFSNPPNLKRGSANNKGIGKNIGLTCGMRVLSPFSQIVWWALFEAFRTITARIEVELKSSPI